MRISSRRRVHASLPSILLTLACLLPIVPGAGATASAAEEVLSWTEMTSGTSSTCTDREGVPQLSRCISGFGEGDGYYNQGGTDNTIGLMTGTERSVLAAPATPAPPTGLTLTPATVTELEISWTAGVDADRTMVRRSDLGFPATIGDGVEVYFGSGTSTSDTGLTQGDTYYYRAWSEVTDGEQQWSDEYAQQAMRIGASWDEMTLPSVDILRGIWGTSADNVFAVGWEGVIVHYDGSSWSSLTSGTTETLWAAWGSSASDVFAVGENGTIRHYSGSEWSGMTSNTSALLADVWGSAGNNVFAVGTGGTILRYNGTFWSPMTSGTENPIEGVWGSSGTDVFAVGPGIFHYDGSTWSAMSTGISNPAFTKVWGSSGSDVFVVAQDGLILHYDGSEWSQMSSGITTDLYAVWGSSGSDVFAAGEGDVILHYDGNSQGAWALMPPDTSTEDYVGVWGSADDDVFAVTSWARILHFGGIVPPSAPSVTTEAVTEISETTATGNGTVTGDGGMPVTERGVCYGTSPTPTTSDSTVTTTGTTGVFSVDLTGLTPGTKYYARAYAVNDVDTGYGDDVSFTTLPVEPSGFSATANGSSRIDLSWTKGEGAIQTMVRRSTIDHPDAVDAGDQVYFSIGSSYVDLNLEPDTIYFYSAWSWVEGSDVWSDAYDTATDRTAELVCVWSAMESGTTEDLWAVDGTSDTDVFALGSVHHYDGTAWSELSGVPDEYLNDLWVAASDDIFVVGNSGLIYRYDGSTWTAMNSGTTNMLKAVWGNSASDVFAVGGSGTVLHYDGNEAGNWTTMSTSFTTTTHYDVWGTSPSEVFAVGSGGLVLRYNGTTWSSIKSGGSPYYGVWGTSGIDLFAVGYGGKIDHYTGSWTSMTSNTTVDLKSVWGSSGTDVFAVGGYTGTVVHYDGEAWSVMTSNTSSALQCIWGTSAYDVFAVGTGGSIIHYGAPPPPSAPTVTTQAVTDIGTTTATGNGAITDTGGEDCVERGICWSTEHEPDIADSTSGDSGTFGTGVFTASMTGLTSGETYYVRAYARNSAGYGYGDEVSFSTLGPPSVTTQAVSAIGSTTATGNGTIVATGGENCDERGVCWSTGHDPDIDDSVASEIGTFSTGAFTASMTGLTPGETYYVRAYAYNSSGYGYGDEVSFTTLTTPTVTTEAVSEIGTTTATGNGTISATGGEDCDERGVCWSTEAEPDIGDSVASETGTLSTGVFTASITGLAPNTKYYVRAYAHNGVGYAYGDDVSFTTEPLRDWGDAPDSYGTTAASDGARHVAGSLYFGSSVDTEADGLPHTLALGDDLDGTDDENGVSFSRLLYPGSNLLVVYQVSGSGKIDAWIDYNIDGDFADAGEQILTNYSVSAGSGSVLAGPGYVPPGATPGTTYARFRLSSLGGLSPTGAADDGEVEDRIVIILEHGDESHYEYGDAPEPYPSTISASYHHNAALGTWLDGESVMQRSLDALGDDSTGTRDDEDGIDFRRIVRRGRGPGIRCSGDKRTERQHQPLGTHRLEPGWRLDRRRRGRQPRHCRRRCEQTLRCRAGGRQAGQHLRPFRAVLRRES